MTDTVPAAPRKPSTLSPLAHRLYLALLLASFASNLGNAIQSVGASWLMTSIAPAADMVALVQTATSLPIALFALIAGAVADLYDRRKVMLTAQIGMASASLLLAGLSFAGLVTPWTLLALTFLLGSGVALFNPSMQVTVGDVVPRAELAGAVSLNILGFNVARSLGPAIGGGIVAIGGSSAAFVVNGFSYVAAIAILAFWRRPPASPPAGAPKRRILPAVLEGLRYVRAAAPIRTILVRAAIFTLGGSAAWGLMPLVARDLVGGGPSAFGMLLSGLGLGAVIGALMSTAVRHRFSNEGIIRGAGIVFGAACLIVAAQPGLAISFVALVVGGAGWVQALSGFSVAGQMWSPRWIVGRVAATINAVVFGGLAIGSWLWGHIAESIGLAPAIATSGALMLVLPLVGLALPLPRNEDADPDRMPQAPTAAG
ncbi:MAG: transporter [Sphingomonas bacterium]|nr:MFS transporter [Sphingomonas bacterium]MDB5688920.1 transporter [Sphingomonas bacterium]